MKQDYVLKKFVRAESAGEAILLDETSKVDEVFLVSEKPDRTIADAIGFVQNPNTLWNDPCDDRISF